MQDLLHLRYAIRYMPADSALGFVLSSQDKSPEATFSSTEFIAARPDLFSEN